MSGVDTGLGGTISLGTQSGSWLIKSIGAGEESGPAVDVSHLGTSGARESIPGDLFATPEVPIAIYFQPQTALPNILAVPETITITLPKKAGISTAATYAGTGFLTKRTPVPGMEVDAAMMSGFTLKFDGFTGPTFTAESA